ncbi:hypothetical protein B0H17DRAFT_1188017 [Mycena rosella]|uniref:Uncharacterized protein n=1 Tax=Mycena rosella TaxID=1033263 RepID=A0AAD7BNX9_MYCRO|nr:hypothetical protein B0H17DRAFT_1188017 [Mycena rosella]
MQRYPYPSRPSLSCVRTPHLVLRAQHGHKLCLTVISLVHVCTKMACSKNHRPTLSITTRLGLSAQSANIMPGD